MATLPKPFPSGAFLRRLPLLRPRFVYLSVGVRELNIPIFLVIPLSLLELSLWTGVWILDGRKLFAWRRSRGEEQARQTLRGLARSLTRLRGYESFRMVEVEAKDRASVKLGLW